MSSLFLVYGLCDPRTGEIRYVGMTTRGLKRIRQHLVPSDLKGRWHGPSHKNNWIRSLLEAGFKPEAVILEDVGSETGLADAERFFIGYFKMIGANLTNATLGGEGTFGYKPPPDVKVRQRRFTGRKHSQETRRRMSEARKGRKWDAETKRKIGKAHEGRIFSEETLKKMSAAQKRRFESKEARKAISDSKKLKTEGATTK